MANAGFIYTFRTREGKLMLVGPDPNEASAMNRFKRIEGYWPDAGAVKIAPYQPEPDETD